MSASSVNVFTAFEKRIANWARLLTAKPSLKLGVVKAHYSVIQKYISMEDDRRLNYYEPTNSEDLKKINLSVSEIRKCFSEGNYQVDPGKSPIWQIYEGNKDIISLEFFQSNLSFLDPKKISSGLLKTEETGSYNIVLDKVTMSSSKTSHDVFVGSIIIGDVSLDKSVLPELTENISRMLNAGITNGIMGSGFNLSVESEVTINSMQKNPEDFFPSAKELRKKYLKKESYSESEYEWEVMLKGD